MLELSRKFREKNIMIIYRYGSITQSSTVLLGSDENNKDIFVPMNQVVPMINPDDVGKL